MKKISPQLAKLVDEAPLGNAWLHEVKYDGYRLICHIENQSVFWMTRNQKNWSKKLPKLTEKAKKLNIKHAILDGELVAIGKNGKSDFQLLQNTIHKHDKGVKLIYFVFDLIEYNHKALSKFPLIERKKLLKSILKSNLNIKYSKHVIGNGEKIYKKACKKGLEGIVSKKISSHYVQKRSSNWLKVKCTKRQEFVICGFTLPQHSRQYFGSLLLGVYNSKGSLEYCGNVGTGFSNQTLKEISQKLSQYVTDIPQFTDYPKSLKKVVWIKPKLVGEVKFTEWTKSGNLRHPSFKGLREDKSPRQINREI